MTCSGFAAARAGVAGVGVAHVVDLARAGSRGPGTTPFKWTSTALPPTTTVAIAAIARSITSGILIPTGPEEAHGRAGGLLDRGRVGRDERRSRPTTRRNLASLSSWSPRTSAATGLPSAR